LSQTFVEPGGKKKNQFIHLWSNSASKTGDKACVGESGVTTSVSVERWPLPAHVGWCCRAEPLHPGKLGAEKKGKKWKKRRVWHSPSPQPSRTGSGRMEQEPQAAPSPGQSPCQEQLCAPGFPWGSRQIWGAPPDIAEPARPAFLILVFRG